MISYDKLLSNISNDFLSIWQNIETKPEVLVNDLTKLDQVIKKIKQLNEEKKICAANIGKLKKQGEDITDKIKQQATLKSQIKQLKEEKSDLENSITHYFEEYSHNNDIPERFTAFRDRHHTDTLSVINIVTIDKVSDDEIDKYVDAHSHATPYHFSCWRNLINNLFHHEDVSIAAINQNNEIQGYLPLIRLKSFLFGDFAVSMPYFNYGGPLADNHVIQNKLVESAIEISRNNNIEHIELRELMSREGLETKQEKVSMVRKLPETSKLLSKEIGTKLRAQINRSKLDSPEVKIGKLELINDFYKVFATNMRDLGTPVYSKEFFYRVIEAWYNESHIVVVYMNNKPVACALLLGYRDMLEIPWASALKKTNKLGINMFMYWNILNFAIQNNYKFFDFGRSSIDSGTFKFKKQWGAIPQQNYWNYWLPEGESLPQINPNNTKYKLLISTWKKLPLFISNVLGPPIVKNIP